MINPSPRRYMRSDATKLSSTDYEDIMQYRDMKSKPLDQLRKKFHISTSRLYQIWRGQEMGRVEWNYSAVPLSYSSTNDIDNQNGTDLGSLMKPSFQNKLNTAFSMLENKIRDAEISKSTDPVSEESAGSKAKKTGGGKKRSQGGQAMPGTKKEIISPTESSEDVLDLYKRTNNDLEKIRASGRALTSK
jgi:hypothetical protein